VFVGPLTLAEALTLGPGAGVVVQLVLSPVEEGRFALRLASRGEPGDDETPWTVHAAGEVGREGEAALSLDLGAVRDRCPLAAVEGNGTYDALRERGLELGPAFRWLEVLGRREGEALARLRAPGKGDLAGSLPLTPGAIDACFQVLAAAVPAGAPTDGLWVPWRFERCVLDDAGPRPAWCHALAAVPSANVGDALAGTALLAGEDGAVSLTLTGISLKRLARRPAGAVIGRTVPGAGGLRDRLARVPPASRRGLLLDWLQDQAATVLELPPGARPDPHQPFLDLGLDSLMAVDLRNRLTAELGAVATIEATVVFDYPTLDDLTTYLGRQLPELQEAAQAVPVPAEVPPSRGDELSEAELERRLRQRIEDIENRLK
jgi:acyl carrier protein